MQPTGYVEKTLVIKRPSSPMFPYNRVLDALYIRRPICTVLRASRRIRTCQRLPLHPASSGYHQHSCLFRHARYSRVDDGQAVVYSYLPTLPLLLLPQRLWLRLAPLQYFVSSVVSSQGHMEAELLLSRRDLLPCRVVDDHRHSYLHLFCQSYSQIVPGIPPHPWLMLVDFVIVAEPFVSFFAD